MFEAWDRFWALVCKLFNVIEINTSSIEKASMLGELHMDHLIANSKLANQMEQLQAQKALDKANTPPVQKKTKK